MNILLTSGGTRVPIDDVRSIVNFSSGKFGQRIATEALLAGHRVTHMHAVTAPTPFEFKVDLVNARGKDYQSQLEELHDFASRNYSRYMSVKFDTYDDYARILKERCTNWQYDAVILCAAVSDAQPIPYSGKLNTDEVDSINLVPTEKLISKVREWQPHSTLVGFKLLSNVGMLQLTDAARKSLLKNKLDMVIANDLRDIAGDEKLCYICSYTKSGIYFVDPVEDTSSKVAKRILSAIDTLVESR